MAVLTWLENFSFPHFHGCRECRPNYIMSVGFFGCQSYFVSDQCNFTCFYWDLDALSLVMNCARLKIAVSTLSVLKLVSPSVRDIIYLFTIQKSEMIHWKENMKSLFTINRSLLPIKLTIFLFSSSAFSLLPYLTIHMTDIGITVDQVAIIYAILPFTGLSFWIALYLGVDSLLMCEW